jgi:hypothetical protein
MKTTPLCADAQSRINVGESWFFHPWQYQELALEAQAYALGRMKGLTPGFFADLPLPDSRTARDYMLLARDAGGDKTAYPDLRRTLTNSSSTMLQFQVLRRVLRAPDAEDLADFCYCSRSAVLILACLLPCVPCRCPAASTVGFDYDRWEALQEQVKRIASKPGPMTAEDTAFLEANCNVPGTIQAFADARTDDGFPPVLGDCFNAGL